MNKKQLKKTLQAEIVWCDAHSPDAWLAVYDEIQRSSLLQSYDYLRVMAQLNFQKLRLGFIHINGHRAGIFALQEAGICKNLLHAVVLDMGPHWLPEYGSDEDFEAFLSAFARTFPKRFGRKRRFIPHVANTQHSREILALYGFKKAEGSSYQTLFLDLQQDEEALRAGLHKKWRNQLNRAEEQNLELVFCDEGQHFAWLMKNYADDKRARGYHGASVKTISALARVFSRGKKLLIGTALLDGTPIASILIFIHGRAATYQIGYSSEIGREKRAHYVLLWRALGELTERKIDAFDLGGINDEDAKGVRDFKTRMGAEHVEFPGLYV